jgi:hypothetical protein
MTPSRRIPDPADLLHAAEDALRQLRDFTAPVTEQSELGRRVVEPLQRQAELLEQLVQRQAQFERDMLGRLTAPLSGALDLLEQSTAAMRAQARAFEAASTSFKQAAELLDLQASLLERAAESVRDPVGAVKAAGGAATGHKKKPGGAAKGRTKKR